MIETLRIEELAIVESATLEFAPGLNVLTGETGAGKSIVLGALSLLAGGRALARTVREGAEQALVEATFRTLEGSGHGGATFSAPENMKLIEEFFDRHLKQASSTTTASR